MGPVELNFFPGISRVNLPFRIFQHGDFLDLLLLVGEGGALAAWTLGCSVFSTCPGLLAG